MHMGNSFVGVNVSKLPVQPSDTFFKTQGWQIYQSEELTVSERE